MMEPEGDAERSKSARSRKRRKHILVCRDSGLGTEERRLARVQFRSIHDALATATTQAEVDQLARENNALFKQSVKYPREEVLDAENLRLIAQKSVEHVESHLKIPRFDATTFVHKLRTKCSADGQFDWHMLGREVGVCFNSLPERVSFLSGPLATEPTTRKKRAPRQRYQHEFDWVEAVMPEQIDEEAQTADSSKLSVAERTIKNMEKKLCERVRENEEAGLGSKVDGVEFLCNPESFTKTVENIFNYSFLVKKGQASMSVCDDTSALGSPRGPMLSLGVAKPQDADKPPQQAVLTFTMRDWRAMCEAMKDTDAPRPDSDDTRKDNGDASGSDAE